MITQMQTDRRNNVVVWRLTPTEARTLADFIEGNVSYGDHAIDDADALRAAADRLEPRPVKAE